MQGSLPVMKITWAVVALVACFLTAGTVLAVTGHSDLANGAFGNITGILLGAGATTTVIVNARNGQQSQQPTDTPKQ